MGLNLFRASPRHSRCGTFLGVTVFSLRIHVGGSIAARGDGVFGGLGFAIPLMAATKPR
jgi:hypothetical protein